MPLVRNVSEFWIYHGSEYVSGLEYAMIWIYHMSSEYASLVQGTEYAWIISKYA